MSWDVEQRRIEPGAVKLAFADAHGPVTWQSMLDAWRRPDSARAFSDALLESGFEGLRWECPPQIGPELAGPFECVVYDDASLCIAPDPVPFRDHLATHMTVAVFPSLGGDSTLVVPTRTNGGATDIAHLAGFLRTAPNGHVAALWHAVAGAVEECAWTEQPFWLSTAGGGVAWLHVRLDDRPKYYRHDPYCEPLHR